MYSNTIQQNTLAGEDIGEFGELMANRQSFLPQIYRIFNIHILLAGYSPKFSPPNNLNS